MKRQTRNIIAATIIGGAIFCLGVNYSTPAATKPTDERIIAALDDIARSLRMIKRYQMNDNSFQKFISDHTFGIPGHLSEIARNTRKPVE